MFTVQKKLLVYWYVAHWELHSFPTRRSSDLDVDRAGGRPHRSGDQGLDQLRHGAGRKPAHHSGTAALHVLVQSRRGLWAVSVPRSEEHTSELQSRENLVCRLLLEKKKLQESR